VGKYPGTRIGALVVALALAGCAARAPEVVDVPVVKHVYCDPGDTIFPELPIAKLKPDAAPADTIRAYASTVAILKGEVIRRDILLDSCRAPSTLVGPEPKLVQAVKEEEEGKSK